MFASRLFLPPSLPPIPKGLMTLPVNSPPAKGGWTRVPQQPASASVSARPRPSLPKGAGCAQLQRSSHPCARARIIYQLFFFFFFFFERVPIKAGSPSFPFCHLLWVESSLAGVGNSNNKKQAPNFNAIYLLRQCGWQTGCQECAKDLDSS